MKFINKKQLKNPKSNVLFIFLLLLIVSCSGSLLNKEDINSKEETNKTDDDKKDDDKTDDDKTDDDKTDDDKTDDDKTDDDKKDESGVILTENMKMEFVQKDEYKWENVKKNFYTFSSNVGNWTGADRQFWENDVTRNRINLTYVPNQDLPEAHRRELIYMNREIGTDAQQGKNLKTLFMAYRFIIHTKEFMEVMEHFYKTSAFANAFMVADKSYLEHKYVDLEGKFYTSVSKKDSNGNFEKISDPRLSLFEFMTRIRSGFRTVRIGKLRPGANGWNAGNSKYRTKFDLEKAIAKGEPDQQDWVADHGWSADDNEINGNIKETFFNKPIIENDTDPNTRDDSILLSANNVGLFLHEIIGHSLFNSGHRQDNYKSDDAFWKEFMEGNSEGYTEIAYVIDDLVKTFITDYAIRNTNPDESNFQGHNWQRIAIENNPTLGKNHFQYRLLQMWKDTSDNFFENMEGVTWSGQGGYYSELVKGKEFDFRNNVYSTRDKYTAIPYHYQSVPITPRQ